MYPNNTHYLYDYSSTYVYMAVPDFPLQRKPPTEPHAQAQGLNGLNGFNRNIITSGYHWVKLRN